MPHSVDRPPCRVCDCSHPGSRGMCLCLRTFDHPYVDDSTVIEHGGQLWKALLRGLRPP
jgi:hypothetical protein